MPRRALALVLSAAFAVGLTACGNKTDRVTRGDTEGAYVDVGALKYQVQISRQLNPFNVEDRDYLVGLNQTDRTLNPNQIYFGVFLRVENDRDKGVSADNATDISIVDTQGNVYRPLDFDPSNVFAYRSVKMAPRQLNPLPNSAAAEGPTQGALVLFKVPEANLANRPLELVIKDPDGTDKASIDLDV